MAEEPTEYEERMKQVPALAKRYVAGEDVEDLSVESKIPAKTLYYHFKKLGISRRGLGTKAVDSAVRQKEIEALKGEAEKIATIAFGIGGVIARRYLPLIDSLLEQNKTLPQIAEDVMEWYEAKVTTNARIDELDAQVKTMQKQLEEANTLALPNFRFLLRTKIYEKYAKRILRMRVAGVRIRIKPTLEALHHDLRMLDSELGSE